MTAPTLENIALAVWTRLTGGGEAGGSSRPRSWRLAWAVRRSVVEQPSPVRTPDPTSFSGQPVITDYRVGT